MLFHRWYTEVKAFEIETVGKSAPKQNNDEQQYQAHREEALARESSSHEDSTLPF